MSPPLPPPEDRTTVFRLATDRPVAVSMCVIAVLVFGVLSARKLPIDLMPEINYPTVTVRTEYPGAAPVEVEDRITRRIEGALAVLNNLISVRSVSRAGMSDVLLEFNWDTPMKLITQEIREKLDRTVLPREIEPPTILRYDPSQEPVMRVGLTSDRSPLVQLRDMAEREVEWRLEQVDGVADVRIRGGLEKEIRIEADPEMLRRYQLTTDILKTRLAEENINLASGLLREGDTEYLVRTLNEFRSVDEIRSLTLTYDAGVPVPLAEVAQVIVSHKERDIITRLNGRESVELLVFKEAGANTVGVANAVRARLFGSAAQHKALAQQRDRERKEFARFDSGKTDSGKADAGKSDSGQSQRRGRRGAGGPERGRGSVDFVLRHLPAGTKAVVLSDQSTFINDSINEVVFSALWGGVLAALMLYLFLGRLKPMAIVVAAIPISVVVTFAPMFLGGITLNIMSLGGLAMGIGMLVDNSIVVTESIFRCRQEGDGMRAAALRGTREVGGAVTASTLTTIAVFFPIVFVQGVAGQIFRDHALTVVFSLLASLVVSLIFVPMLAARGDGLAALRADPGRRLAALWSMPWSVRNVIASVRAIGRRSPFVSVPMLLLNLALLPLQLTLEAAARLTALISFLVLGLAFLIARLVAKVCAPIAGLLMVRPFNFLFGLIAGAYPPLLALAFRARFLVVLACLALVGVAVALAPKLGSELLPEVHQGEFSIRLALPLGTPVERTDTVIRPFAARILEVPGVTTVVMAAGVARDEVADSDEGEHSVRILVRLDAAHRRPAAEARVKERIRVLLKGNPDLTDAPQFENPSIFATRTPIEVIIKARSLARLRAVAARVEEKLAEPGFSQVSDVRTNIRAGNPEVVIIFDRRKLVDLGLSLETVALRVRTALQGDVATRFNDRDRKVDMVVRLDQEVQSSLDRLRRMIVNPEEPFPRPLEDVAEVRRDTGPAEIFRVNQQRAALIRANLVEIDLGKMSTRIDAMLREIEAEEPDVVMTVGGQNAEMKSAASGMLLALLLALFLVYVVMASQFENLLHPFVILLTFPLATIGVVPVLYALGLRLNVVVGIGAIMLSGIVVNDAIVLVDYVNQLRRRGLSRREALLQAGRVRLRPIMMTTLTTVLGLVPLTGAMVFLPGFGAGEGVELRAPMAITVIAGLLSATLLTLVVIPVVYDLLDFGSGHRRRDGEQEASP